MLHPGGWQSSGRQRLKRRYSGMYYTNLLADSSSESSTSSSRTNLRHNLPHNPWSFHILLAPYSFYYSVILIDKHLVIFRRKRGKGEWSVICALVHNQHSDICFKMSWL